MATSASAASASAYKKLTPREHILVRPDSYIGSRTALETQRWVWNPAEGRMNWRTLMYNPGLFKIFDELVVNALDHVVRQAGAEKSARVSQIVVTLTPTMFRIYNDGAGIPVEVHPEYKVMAPELIFGHLLTSSNYDDTEEKVVGGKNGFGAKLTNIYSTRFTVRTCDTDRRFLFEQTFTENMSVIGKPVLGRVTKAAKAFTEVTAYPDLARFYPELAASGAIEMPVEMLDVLCTRVVDMAALAAPHGVTVFLSTSDAEGAVATPIPVTSFEAYARLFAEPGVPVFYERCGPRWEIAAVLTRHLHADGLPDDRHISFVNGIFTRRGGKHVDTVARTVLGAFCDGPGKKFDLKPAQLKDAVTFFVNATIVNPDFESQSKETLTTIASRFGSKFEVSDKFVTRLAKEGGLLEEAAAVLESRLMREAKKVDGKKTASVRGIPKLEDAAWAGTAKSEQCTLILTEGDSAAALAIAGLAVVGREKFGVFPLRGKPLNVRDASVTAKTDNVELTHIKQILGLVHGRKYTDLKSLRYGRVMIMTDQDVDGSHIKGLLINMFDAEWPELLKLPFLLCMMTPLLKATKGKTVHQFYSSSEYETWLKTAEAAGGRGWTVKYYKGLGTSTAAEGREYFKSMNTVGFTWDETTRDTVDMAFNKERADDRKAWLETYDRDRIIEVPAGGISVSYTRFVNDELIHFSIASNHRGIPHLMDGFKPSLRKILWAARKRGLTSEIKVAQLAGYVSEHAAYHHGEASLLGAIIGMAQNYVGSNNINLLVPSGQFGTRLEGGKDAAAPRYIFTSLDPVQAALFHKADDPALTWIEDDGQRVEPEYYMPVLPLLLVNGAEGLGTGHSTSIPCHSPRDIVAALRGRLSGAIADLSETTLSPWWDGFRGTITPGAGGRSVVTHGVFQFFDDEGCRVRITELPVGVWTKDYKAFLEELLAGEERPRLGGHKKPAAGSAAAAAAAKKTRAKATALKPAGGAGDAASVTSSVKSAPVKLLRDYQANYNDVDVDFVLTLDPEYYVEAKLFPSEFEKKFKLTSSHSLTNMVAFGTDGILRKFGSAGEIMETFYGVRLAGYATRKANELARLAAEIVELEARVRFVRAVVAGTLKVANAADEELLAGLIALGVPALSGGEGLRGFEYLLRMRVDRLKAAAVAELEAELATVRATQATLAAKSPEMLWLEDLDGFDAAYEAFCAARAAGRAEAAATSGGAATGEKKKRAVRVTTKKA
jgi:DNA topoisomerase-2